MNYGSGSVSGDLVNDTVKFADFAELHNHTFGVTKTESRQFTAYVFSIFFSIRSHEFRGRNEIPLDGVLGCAKQVSDIRCVPMVIHLAPQSLSMQQTPTFITALKTAGLIAERIWSFKISRKSDGKNDGEVTVGAMDPSKFDPLSLVCVPNVNDAGFWEAKLDALTVGRPRLLVNTTEALHRSMASMSSWVTEAVSSIQAPRSSSHRNEWVVRCCD
jgi:hypothetical protein